ncbi:uncharacterized protein At3g49055 isoform X2 [Diospyros lotus]|uniref:uncharacterized protein At3g49055 isoform X2 n=1 Tax=Diospyros lotus TaxID=55363 RepID=UPI002256B7D8|nr:uncharacterized protein At3g49055 isoform X2 [Diospyros lotus]
MEATVAETPSSSGAPADLRQPQLNYDSLAAELEALRVAYRGLQVKSASAEANLVEALKRNAELRDELLGLQASLREREGVLKEDEGIRNELDGYRKRERVYSGNLGTLRSAKECLLRAIESLGGESVDGVVDEWEELRGEVGLESLHDNELRAFVIELKAVAGIASVVETRVSEYHEMRKKEKRELESSVVSLTEENRDINSLLRIALVEKEAVEKSLNKLKGNSEQKRVAILQIAERGLQRVGFGFMMGTGTNEPSSDNSGANSDSKSDGSECEEEVPSLASAVERIMKNLRLEITQLRRSLEESRSDTERLQSLTEIQAQKISENALYIKALEDRETMLAQNVEEFLMEIKETEEDVARWREACELEVEAGKNAVEERDKVVSILKLELDKTKSALDISNSKLKLKEELAAAAMAAQAAAERSLQLADSRASELCERIEELTRQLEKADSREHRRHKVRHCCWPWQTLKVNPSGTDSRNQNIRQMLPEMQALLP